MQVTKNEKVVKVIQEETYDIKGLTKAEAIALLLVTGNTNGTLLYDFYHNLKVSLGDDCLLSAGLRDLNGKITIQDVASLEDKINKLSSK